MEVNCWRTLALEKQSILSFKDLKAEHIGSFFQEISSKQGFCEKVPSFVKYLYQEWYAENSVRTSLR
jgi:hypothetical protein